MSLNLRNSTAIAALAFSAAASAQNIWLPPAPGYVAPPPVFIPSPAEQCRQLSTQFPPQKSFRSTGDSFLQAGNIACRLKKGLDGGWLLAETYALRSEKGVNALVTDLNRAEKADARLAQQEARNAQSHRSEPQATHHQTDRRKGYPAPQATTAFGHKSAGPGKKHETFEEIRDRRLREAGLIPR